jgi:hypothetical protein
VGKVECWWAVALLLGHCSPKLLGMEPFYWPTWHTTQQHYGPCIPTFGESWNNCVQPMRNKVLGNGKCWNARFALQVPSFPSFTLQYVIPYVAFSYLVRKLHLYLHATFTLPYVYCIKHPLRLVRYFITLHIRF